MNLNNLSTICPTCGGELIAAGDKWQCKYCGNLFEKENLEKEAELIKKMLDEQKKEQIANLRRNLYDAVTAKHISSLEIRRICQEIKKLLPDDFLANFYDIANRNNLKGIAKFLQEIDIAEQIDLLDLPIEFLIRSLHSEFLLELNNLIEAAYHIRDPKKYEKYATDLSIAAEKVAQGVYDTTLPRDAFIAYSSQDMAAVEELVATLEEQGLSCFVAARNLRHGRNAVEDYDTALKQAIDNCRSFVFVSGPNSRNLGCDALKVEIAYVKECDRQNAPGELRNNYAAIPHQYKKPRVEYWIGDSVGKNVADIHTKEFFNGYERVYTPDSVAERVAAHQLDTPIVSAPTSVPANTAPKNEKYCADCGAKNIEATKFCCECGKGAFYDTLAEYVAAKERLFKKQKADLIKEQKKAQEEKEKAAAAKKALEKEKKTAPKPSVPRSSSSGSGFSLGSLFKKVYLTLAIIAAIVTVIVMIAQGCGSESADPGGNHYATIYSEALGMDVYEYNGHYYKLFTDPVSTFEEAQAYCQSIGGHLAVPTDEGENELLVSIARQDYPQGSDKAVYIGGYKDNSSNWNWVTGESFAFTSWASGQPDNTWYYITLWPSADFQWDDTNGYHYFLCEWDEESALGDGSYFYTAVGSVEDLKKLNGSSENFRLTNDIDLSEIEWTPIENFSGVLDGKEYSIYNLQIDQSGDNIGLFSTLSGTVKNLNISGANVQADGNGENVGILCGTLTGTATNIHVSDSTVDASRYVNVGGVIGNITANSDFSLKKFSLYNTNVEGKECVGGIVGLLISETTNYKNHTISLSELDSDSAVSASDKYVGGIVGKLHCEEYGASVTVSIEKCTNRTSVEGKTYAGGIVGYVYSDSTESILKNCEVSATVIADAYVGCLAGYLENIEVTNCQNDGSYMEVHKYVAEEGNNNSYAGGFVGCMIGNSIGDCRNTIPVSATGNYVGGIVGYIKNSYVNECENNSEIQSNGSYVGGIAGYMGSLDSITLEDMKNFGAISGKEYVGGIFGMMDHSTNTYRSQTVNIGSFDNSGTITASSDYAGGIFGKLKAEEYGGSVTVAISDLKNYASVTGLCYVGGIGGHMTTDSADSIMRYCSTEGDIRANAIVGCIAGKLEYINVSECENNNACLYVEGHITEEGQNNSYAGGFVGQMINCIITNCESDVLVLANGNYVGGFCGYMSLANSYEIEGLILRDARDGREYAVEGANYVGGIFGYLVIKVDAYSDMTFSIKDCEFHWGVIGNNYVGGIIGELIAENRTSNKLTTYISDCHSAHYIEGNSYVGGIFGKATSDSTDSSITNTTATGGVIANQNYGDIVGAGSNITVK